MYTEYMKAYAAYYSYGRSAVCSFKQESKVRLMAIYLEKGSLLTEVINLVINVAIEAGLNNFWCKNVLDTLQKKAVVVAGHILMNDYTILLLAEL